MKAREIVRLTLEVLDAQDSIVRDSNHDLWLRLTKYDSDFEGKGLSELKERRLENTDRLERLLQELEQTIQVSDGCFAQNQTEPVNKDKSHEGWEVKIEMDA